MFSLTEISYLRCQFLTRLVSFDNVGQLELLHLGFDFDGLSFWIGSHLQGIYFRTEKYRNVKQGYNNVAFVLNDLESVNSWK